jgi:parallel beta-helix repeat protein
MGAQRTSVILLLILSSVLFSFTEIKITKADTPDIYIRADGSIDGTDKIQRDGNVYSFTDDIYSRIEIQRSNIILDGAGYGLIKGDRDFAINIGTTGDVPEPIGVNGITIMNLTIIGFNYGITLGGENSIIQSVNITDSQSYNGIPIWVSGSNHIIQECRITNNKAYGMLIHATDVLLSNNYISDNGDFGIKFYANTAILRNNTLNNNRSGPFYVDEGQISSNAIDPSNMVDGKPVYYWVNEHNKTVPPDAGYVVLDNCTNINVKDLSINRNSIGRFFYGSSGIRLFRTTNSVISNNALNGTGIYISVSSKNVLINNNRITNGSINSWGSNISIVENSVSAKEDNGISVGGSSHEIANNNLTNCKTGIYLQSQRNSVTQNRIVDCGVGINLFSSNNNVFCQNSFIDNTQHVSDTHYTLEWPLETYYQSFNNTWDGNFWSGYNGIDIDGEGIGDTPYIIYEEQQDNYPLMNAIPEFPSWIILPLFLIVTMAVTVYKKKLTRSFQIH